MPGLRHPWRYPWGVQLKELAVSNTVVSNSSTASFPGREGKLLFRMGLLVWGVMWVTEHWVKVPGLGEGPHQPEPRMTSLGLCALKGERGTGEGLPTRGQEPWF